MSTVGKSKFERILKEQGGIEIDDGYIKYIVSNPMPDGLAHLVYLSRTQMQFTEIDRKLKTRLHIYMHELKAYRGFFTKNILYVHFNGKVYRATHKEPFKRVEEYLVYHIVLDEV